MASNESNDLPPASSTNPEIPPSADPMAYVTGELKRAFEDIARGEQTASLLEASLTALESKLDAILAAAEVPDAEERDVNSDQGVVDRRAPPGSSSAKEEEKQ
ncbi:hypothetical protein SAPIO_CDS3356 [Scedosporium apiospermum]|uniref:Uncharacterized protein n=1 Tax=Pseudallescheria apiosperma TaxID=563466 RepID=A0A084GAL1_PSEDA|nr:uncharacterized protein SAPIO_CDS3356 [Scedosporium apiospermum]KEZ44373.1 hypothetical protein SAPIO_CDS3356 [Scedosporium apiospermum]